MRWVVLVVVLGCSGNRAATHPTPPSKPSRSSTLPATPDAVATELVQDQSIEPPPVKTALSAPQLADELRAGDGWSPQRYITGPVNLIEKGGKPRLVSRRDAIVASGEWKRMLADPVRASPRCRESKPSALAQSKPQGGSQVMCFQTPAREGPFMLLLFCVQPRLALHTVLIGDRAIFRSRVLEMVDGRTCPPLTP